MRTVEKTPSGQKLTRQDWTISSPAIFSSWMPVICPSKHENAPPADGSISAAASVNAANFSDDMSVS